MAPQVKIWVVADDLDPRRMAETEDISFVLEPRRPAERDYSADHIVLGYN